MTVIAMQDLEDESDEECLDHTLEAAQRIMSVRCFDLEQVADRMASDAVERQDVTLTAALGLFDYLTVPESSRRTNVIPKGAKSVRGTLLGL